VLVSGDREWKGQWIVTRVMEGICAHDDILVIHGDARGADTCARIWAEASGNPQRRVPAKWYEHDREGLTPVPCRCPADKETCGAAGPRRNQQMLDEEHPEILIAFHDDLEASKGTKDMVKRAKAAGLPGYVIRHI